MINLSKIWIPSLISNEESICTLVWVSLFRTLSLTFLLFSPLYLCIHLSIHLSLSVQLYHFFSISCGLSLFLSHCLKLIISLRKAYIIFCHFRHVFTAQQLYRYKNFLSYPPFIKDIKPITCYLISGILRSVVKRNTDEIVGDHSEDRNAEKKVQLIMSTATLTKAVRLLLNDVQGGFNIEYSGKQYNRK